MKRRIRLSQAMIVKNEEKNIERALTWGKDIMCEQIVVDTGSTDKTVEIAESLGAKVFRFEWINDFSAAKNFAIEQCNGNWIAFLDADEYFNEQDSKRLIKYVQETDDNGGEGIFTMLVNLDSEGRPATSASQIRIFKKLSNLRYKRRIHEQLCHEDGHNIKVLDATQELTIWHTGYAGETGLEKRKSNRNLNMILKEIEDFPDGYDMYVHLGNEYFNRDRFDLAEKAYQMYIDHISGDILGTDADAADAFLHHLYCLLKQDKDIKTLFDAYNYAVIRIKQNADIPFTMGRCLYNAGLYEEACQCLVEAIRRLETFGTLNKSQIAMQNINLIYEMLSDSTYKLGDIKSAVKYSSTLISVNRSSIKGLIILLRSFKGYDDNPIPVSDVINYLRKIYDFNSLRDIEVLKAAARAVDYKGLDEAITE